MGRLKRAKATGRLDWKWPEVRLNTEKCAVSCRKFEPNDQVEFENWLKVTRREKENGPCAVWMDRRMNGLPLVDVNTGKLEEGTRRQPSKSLFGRTLWNDLIELNRTTSVRRKATTGRSRTREEESTSTFEKQVCVRARSQKKRKKGDRTRAWSCTCRARSNGPSKGRIWVAMTTNKLNY